MKRRTFLQTMAAIPAGLLGLRKTEPAYRPPPRWEWEVGEWEDDDDFGGRRRKYTALATVLNSEMHTIAAWVGVYSSRIGWNAHSFLGVRQGQLRLSWLSGKYVGDGLVEATATLEETSMEVRWAGSPANFHNLFRGGNEIAKPINLERQL